MFRSRSSSPTLLIVLCTCLLASVIPALISPSVTLAANAVTGAVFQDYNANGKRDTTTTTPNSGGNGSVRAAIDSGVGAVTVTAFDATNTAVATANTAADGSYTLAVPAAGPYRIEFSNLPTGFEPTAQGTTANTTVQFVVGPTMVANLGINRPVDYCQDNPTMVVNCFVQGDQLSGPYKTDNVLKSFPYAAGSNRTVGGTPFTDYDNPTTHATQLAAQTIGTTWGIAWARSTKSLYTSAFFRRHAGFGPGAQGAIYVINPQTNAVVQTWTLPAATINAHDTANYSRDNGNTGWDAVGKTSIGGIALSDDETTLYVMSLQDRTLYALNAATGVVITSQQIPLTSCSAAGDARPFAVKYYRDTLYVGLVCSAESSGIAADLHAYIYTANRTTLAFSATPVFDFGFNYARGKTGFGSATSATWNAWTPTFANVAGGTFDAQTNLLSYPQPMLSDIEFDSGGNMILGLRDRGGDQGGYREYSGPIGDNKLYLTASGGDTLYACLSSPGNWTLESNGRCNGQGNSTQNGQGPGGREYYYADNLLSNHDEISLGGLGQVPGFPDVVSTVFDPVPMDDNATNNSDGGVRWWANSTGDYTKGYRLYDGHATIDDQYFGKANGLGDLIALCDTAPIEIGNRVWRDDNHNGVQDPGEPPIAGIVVQLYDAGGTLVPGATATTDATGTYAFSSATGTSTGNSVYNLLVQPNTAYSVRIDTTQAALAPFALTTPDANSGANSDSRDSDATLTGSSAIIALTTGASGANNHTYDFGFFAPVSVGNQVWLDTNNDGQIGAGEVGIDGVRVELFLDSNNDKQLTGTEQTPVAVQNTANGGYYLFMQTTDITGIGTGVALLPGTYFVGIASSNFTGAGVLAGYQSSGTSISNAGVVNDATIAANGTTDSDADNADDGTKQTGVSFYKTGPVYGVLSGSLVVTANGEPVSEPTFGQTAGTTPGHSNSVGSITIPDRNSNLTVDFGFYRQTLGNLVFDDANNNGTYEAATEQPLAGATVKLYNQTGATEIPVGPDGILGTADDAAGGVTTGADGTYTFKGLPQGQYVVKVTPPAGYTSSTDVASSANPDGNIDNDDNGPGGGQGLVTSNAITLTPGSVGAANKNLVTAATGTTDNPTLDFGFYTLSLGNQVWNDVNNNGLKDTSESGLDGVVVNLYQDLNNDGTLTAADKLVGFQTTANGGYYLFSGLPPATYFVQLAPSNFQAGGALVGYTSSTGANGATAGPYEPVLATGIIDKDDNGTIGTGGLALAGPTGGIASRKIDLTANTQPTGESDFGTPTGTPDTTPNANSNFTIDFGVFKPAGLGDYVWIDTNKNGIQDGGEVGVNGVRVSLYTLNGADGIAGNADDTVAVATTTTATNAGVAGYYHFGNLTPNTTYTIALDRASDFKPGGPLAGYTLTSNDKGGDDTLDSDATLSGGVPTIINATTGGPGTDILTYDFGFNTSASLGDYVWLDGNNNGIQDATETGINGVTVNLYNSTGTTLLATTMTANNGTNDGYYHFANLDTTTTYMVKLNNPADFIGTGPLANTKLSPANQGGDPTKDSNGVLVGSTPTIANALTGGPGTDTPTYDLGFYRPSASLGDYVWNDANKNGVQDGGETGINGVTVNLYDSTGTTLIATKLTTTNNGALGYYHFDNLVPNTTYIVKLDNASDYTPAGPLASFVLAASNQGGDPARDSDATLSGNYPTIGSATTGADGSNTQTYDIGLYQPLSLGNLVWKDANNNGMVDAGEAGFDGVKVNLYRDTDGSGTLTVGDTLVTSQITSNGGHYLFTDLGQGSYVVQLDAANFQAGGVLAGYVSSIGAYAATGPYEPGATSTADNDDNGTNLAQGGIVSSVIVLAPGAQPTNEPDTALPAGVTNTSRDDNSNLTLDFGVFQPARLGSLVWNDQNTDGVHQPSEPGVPNVTVTLYNVTNTPVATTITDANGAYQFINLPPGTYTVGFTNLPSGFVFTIPKQGSDATDSDVNVGTGRTIAVTVVPGDAMLTIFAGLTSNPTAITLTRFTATRNATAVAVNWTTSAEVNTFGFRLYRSATSQRADAVEVTTALIVAQGRGQGGASYTWNDATAQVGVAYTYWLEETEIDGTTHSYGPALLAAAASPRAVSTTRMFLPLLTR